MGRTLFQWSTLIFISLSFTGCSTESNKARTPALFSSEAEAKKAAKNFNCTEAHKMGDKWMPCKNHKNHQENQNHVGHGHHHNH